MAKLIKCKIDEVNHGDTVFKNNLINIDLCSEISKRSFNINDHIFPEIVFVLNGDQRSWRYNDISLRDKQYEDLFIEFGFNNNSNKQIL
jgi:hypothetical protein